MQHLIFIAINSIYCNDLYTATIYFENLVLNMTHFNPYTSLKNAISKPIHFFFFINLSIVFLSIFHSHFNSFLSTSILYSFFYFSFLSFFSILDGLWYIKP